MDENNIDDDENDEGDIDHDALQASMKALVGIHHRARFGPPVTVNIAQELYTKAQDHQDQLTQEERQLLLSRGDVIGKALAQPSSLTDAERNEVMGRPHPDDVRIYIERATDGHISTPAELTAKARANLRDLSKDELDLVAHNFNETVSMSMNNTNHAVGAKEAKRLLMPVEEQDMMVAAIRLRIMGPETSWEAYIASQKEAEEQRRRAEAIAEAIRKEECERESQAVQNKILQRRRELQALGGREEDPQQLQRHNETLDAEIRAYCSNLEPQYPVPPVYTSIPSVPAGQRHFATPPYPPVPGRELGRGHVHTATMVYANEQRERVREENPDITWGQVGKLMGDRWKEMSAEERAPYEARATQNLKV